MPRKISAKRRAALINDLINADFDLTELHSKYALSPDSLSQWFRTKKTTAAWRGFVSWLTCRPNSCSAGTASSQPAD